MREFSILRKDWSRPLFVLEDALDNTAWRALTKAQNSSSAGKHMNELASPAPGNIVMPPCSVLP